MSTLARRKPREDRRVWVMPEWMERYRPYLLHVSGGLELEDVMNDHDSNTFNNAYRALVCCATKSAVGLLHELRRDGLLISTDTESR